MTWASNRALAPKMSGSGVKVIEVPVPRALPSAFSFEVARPRAKVCT